MASLTKSPDDPFSLKVMSMNVFARPPGIHDNKNGDSKYERLRALLAEIDEFDVVCLQELFATGSTRQEWFIRKAFAKGFRHFHRTPQPAIFSKYFVDGGLCIISRFPLADLDCLRFSRGLKIDGVVEKGVLHAKVVVSHGLHEYFHLFVTRTQAGGMWAVRKHQIGEMAHFMKRLSRDGAPILLAGDFNTDSRHPNVDPERFHMMSDILNSARFENANRYQPPTDPTTPASTATRSRTNQSGRLAMRNLALETYGFPPVTNGHGHGRIWTAMQPTLREKDGAPVDPTRVCIDYMFFYPGISPSSSQSTDGIQFESKAITVRDKSTKVLPFQVSGSRLFTQVSDHYALTTTLLVPEHSQTSSHISNGSAYHSTSASGDLQALRFVSVTRYKPCITIALLVFLGILLLASPLVLFDIL
eukprot:332929_1